VPAFVEARLPGEHLVWRDILMEGPVSAAPGPADLAARAAYLTRFLDIDAEEYRAVAEGLLAGLARAAGHDEVVLWFDADLFCVANGAFVLHWLAQRAPEVRVSLGAPSPTAGPDVASLSPTALAALYAQRAPLSAPRRARMSEAWVAYSAPDPAAIAALLEREAADPAGLAGAWRAHLRRYPSPDSGLNEVEAATLALLDARGPLGFDALFRALWRQAPIAALGMGDQQLAAVLREMAGAPAPLVKIDSGGSSIGSEGWPMLSGFRGWQVALRDAGRDVLAGRLDHIAANGIDRYLGGVHLHGHHRIWRWHEREGTLVLH
jgi:hypothetical protein